MHCSACDVLMTEAEDARKSRATGERIGLCNKCFGYIEDEVEVTENPELEDMGIDLDDEELNTDELDSQHIF